MFTADFSAVDRWPEAVSALRDWLPLSTTVDPWHLSTVQQERTFTFQKPCSHVPPDDGYRASGPGFSQVLTGHR